VIEGSRTQRNERRDFVEWHRGRSPYVFWALDVDTPDVGRRVAAAQRHLSGLLLDGYERQPHVTLELCGFAATAPLLAEDEFDASHLEAQVAAMPKGAPAPFEIEIGPLDSFTSAPYLALDDASQGIAAVRACLAIDGAWRLFGDYVPHVTVGLYADAWPADAVGARLASFGMGEPVRLRIGRVSLMSYDPARIGGPLGRLGCFHLDSRDMRWQGEAARFSGLPQPA